jgi:hypothetical protein
MADPWTVTTSEWADWCLAHGLPCESASATTHHFGQICTVWAVPRWLEAMRSCSSIGSFNLTEVLPRVHEHQDALSCAYRLGGTEAMMALLGRLRRG